jgi:dTDP-4-dehydrorhamnose reductase
MYIVLGKNGYIAEAIVRELKSHNLPHVAWSRTDVNYLDYHTFKREIINIKINNHLSDVVSSHSIKVINCAGFIGKPNVDACELAKADCIEGNILFPQMLSLLSIEMNFTFVQISSGCIYGGYDKHFTEKDPSNFDFQNGSFYSGTKALAEKIIQKINKNSYIFRLRIPFDEYASPRNYITKLLSYDKLLNLDNSLSHRADFAKYSIDLIEKQVPKGIYNITNKGFIDAKGVIKLIEKYKLSNKNFKFFDNIESFGKEVIAPRSNCILDTSKIEKYIKIRTTKEALEDALSKYNKL